MLIDIAFALALVAVCLCTGAAWEAHRWRSADGTVRSGGQSYIVLRPLERDARGRFIRASRCPNRAPQAPNRESSPGPVGNSPAADRETGGGDFLG